ncbi:hypothetical protein N801_06735 [Knoellia aerolata DSM 18566]|uniref:Uncharacterized protein n=1 Tax=Knoellia aerolata DSM 18566 TaxID=1385519 RepID=A0A0A0JXU1_9MICO|nr:hypothetical protein N801_06735 [Knoellia aerolata DSM 18566]
MTRMRWMFVGWLVFIVGGLAWCLAMGVSAR